jgi:hypothetical protein
MYGTDFLVRRVLDFQFSCVCSWEAQLVHVVGIDFVWCDVDVLMETELILDTLQMQSCSSKFGSFSWLYTFSFANSPNDVD